MYLHIGQDFLVRVQDIVSIFDMDTATVSKRTEALLFRLQAEGRVIDSYEDLPRSAVLCVNGLGEYLYLSQITSKALQKRAEKVLGI